MNFITITSIHKHNNCYMYTHKDEEQLQRYLKGYGTEHMIKDTIIKYRMSVNFTDFQTRYGSPDYPIIIKAWSLKSLLFNNIGEKKYKVFHYVTDKMKHELQKKITDHNSRTIFQKLYENKLPLEVIREVNQFV